MSSSIPGPATPPPPMSTTDSESEDEMLAADDEMDISQDCDSAYGSLESDAMSLASSIMKFCEENGRVYHGWKPERGYILPSDEEESKRLDLQHQVFSLTFDGALHICPAGKEGPPLKRVLDAGTGTGIWAIDFAEAHPETHVVGVDLSPIQPTFVPANVTFYVDDLEDDWDYEEPFDFIYGRMLSGALMNYPAFIKQAFDNLSPGGWFELADITLPVLSDDGTLPPDSALMRWCEYSSQAGHILGHLVDEAQQYKRMMLDAGFVRVSEMVYKWPTNPWPRDRKYKLIGHYSDQNLSTNLYGISARLFTRGLGWTTQELEEFLVDVKKDLSNRSYHAYWTIYVVYGQKPEW